MANHFTPEELAKDLGMDSKEVVRFCIEEGIPIYKGKVDRHLLTVVMRAKGMAVPAEVTQAEVAPVAHEVASV